MPHQYIVDRVREVLVELFPDLSPEQLDRLALEQAAIIIDRHPAGKTMAYIDLPVSLIDRLLLTRLGRLVGRLINRHPRCKRIPVRIDPDH